MGTGQMLITIGAIMLLGTVILNTNRGINNSSQVLRETSFTLEDVSYATTIIQKAEGLYFDEKCSTDTLEVTNPAVGFTPVTSLGYENNDPTDLDDIDDFNGKPGVSNGYGLDSANLATGLYYAKTRVHYVALSNLDAFASTPTFHKRLDVWVWNKDEFDESTNEARKNDTLHMATIISYWAF
jgi:hypothetical protein